MMEIEIEENCAQSNDQTPEKKAVNELKDMCLDNAQYFSKDSSENGQRLYNSFLTLIDALDLIWPKVCSIKIRVTEFDIDETTPGNGYRSFINVFNMSVTYASGLIRNVTSQRSSASFEKTLPTKDIETCSHLISSLDTCFGHLQTMMSWMSDGNLFPEHKSMDEMISVCRGINQYCFYGRCVGFQFCQSLRAILQFVSLSMAIFSEAYYTQGSLFAKAKNSVVTAVKYILDPELRARRIVNISENADVDFCKSFWFLSECTPMNGLPSVVGVDVCQAISLTPQPFALEIDDRIIEVPVPSSYLGPKPVHLRLISYKLRRGMLGSKNKAPSEPPADGLIVHCHGGGFVSQSSKSHESYLRDWAKRLNVPIISVDYSLAPEAPFPRAHEEMLYAYCWILKNHHLLGSTGKRIIAAGDSAGANLLLSLTLKCVNENIPPPHGVFVAYVPTLIKFVPSPSRLLCMMDPMLPFGFMMRCLKAYACPIGQPELGGGYHSDTESFEEISESDLDELQAHKSPVSDASDTLTYGSLTSNPEEEIDGKGAEEIEKNEIYATRIVQEYILSTKEAEPPRSSTADDTCTESSTSTMESVQLKVTDFVANIKGQFTKFLKESADRKKKTPKESAVQNEHETQGRSPAPHKKLSSSLLEEVCNFSVPRDPYLSPYLASDEDLNMFPTTKILTVELDPCLDDCVMFAKRLKRLGKDVTLDILQGLPHGFLNFSLISEDAHAGSKLCVQRIRELLDPESSVNPANLT
ncbi:hormone-sensitive lipase isoform X2 [Cylas formicarius]|uniref:hormone-sensitive lipase isoform X2 n=1 Tax=Cylas formicarius TaxID=197179 RepID=UPI0029588871|nr:hormone-sensitive lipase isoform X2 [Cylas formicarius]